MYLSSSGPTSPEEDGSSRASLTNVVLIPSSSFSPPVRTTGHLAQREKLIFVLIQCVSSYTLTTYKTGREQLELLQSPTFSPQCRTLRSRPQDRLDRCFM